MLLLQEVNMAYDIVKEVDCLDVTKEGTEAWDAACKRYLPNLFVCCEIHAQPVEGVCYCYLLMLHYIASIFGREK